ncbi:MAG: thiamine pyrophosphate-binding protein [Chloroflexi bacterium]|nr:thiamine pyrophosphate-binding protein [Chloroflexota bacterium]
MAQTSGGRMAARMFKKAGIEYIFGLCGLHIDEIFQGCKDEGIKIIDTRHEQAAAFMAEAYAKFTRKPAVAIFTAGPGVANAFTGIWNAMQNGSPVVFIGGRSPFNHSQMGDLQECDFLPAMKTITKWSEGCYDARRIPEFVSIAIRHAISGRPGPVYLEIPWDIVDTKVEENDITLPDKFMTDARPQGDPEILKRTIDLLLNARKPIVIGGSGIWWANASTELKEFLELANLPFCSIRQSIGQWSLPSNHPLLCTDLASLGTKEADVVIIIGARLDFRLGYGRTLFRNDARFIQIDIDPNEIGHNRPVDAGIAGDARLIIKQMVDEIKRHKAKPAWSNWTAERQQKSKEAKAQLDIILSSDQIPISQARLCKEINKYIDDDTIITLDGGRAGQWGSIAITRNKPGMMLGNLPSATLGVGPSFAMAAKLAYPDKKVLLISGDGSFGLNAMEFDTMVRHNIPIVCVISNDSAWGVIIQSQLTKGSDRTIGTQLAFVHYEKVVEAVGGYGEMVEKPEDIHAALDRAFASGLPACINVKCSTTDSPGRFLH